MPEGSSQKTALIVADLSVGATDTHGFARRPSGPAWVAHRRNYPDEPYRFDRDRYWIAAAHEIGHSVYNLRHPWKEWRSFVEPTQPNKICGAAQTASTRLTWSACKTEPRQRVDPTAPRIVIRACQPGLVPTCCAIVE